MNKIKKPSQCVHSGKILMKDKGLVSPIFPSTSYDFANAGKLVYPRYFNTPNQGAVIEKLRALENGGAGLVFSSGMAAICTTLFSLLKPGEHAIFQHDLYGGTHHAIVKELDKFKINYTFVDGSKADNFAKAMKKETRVIYIESPSNPLMKLTDIPAVAELASANDIITVIDNTFASPINQNPIDFGIDVVIHSGTKYLSGHSDLCCGAVITNNGLAQIIQASAVNFGGSINAYTCYLLERSLKTLSLRVNQQNANAMKIALFLQGHSRVKQVNYPGLNTHPGHEIAKKQMAGGFGGMLSFEIDPSRITTHQFLERLKLIEPAMSLGGVETIVCISAETSHSKLSHQERIQMGISDDLLRLSVGVEDPGDLIADLEQALS